ncbi:hypothetical protein [Pseudomonas leptonychotis]|uniref:Uncharacterized protein n=1 Tax=Pseudomonas leptonychotis TaxID=2448482 RepID=A0A4T1ZTD2_9PSED|nr:hypothetical protein [Pseudomonas leptonychotis]TIH06236.1 hypothetical protein D8779_20395 [Pseudomonas leptonychotis]
MEIALYISAILVLCVAAAHSYLGERYILIRLFRKNDLTKLFGSTEFTTRTLRFAWHLTSIAWLGLASVLVLLAHPPIQPRIIGLVIGIIFLAHFAIALAGSKGKHLSWPVFLIIGALAIYATNT